MYLIKYFRHHAHGTEHDFRRGEMKMLKKLKFVKFSDIMAIFALLIVLIPAMVVKIFVRDFWLVCEDKNEARDNGYWFFKYVKENHPKQKIAYAINKKSPDYLKVKNIGKIINYGGLSHWFWFIVADKNISSQKGGKPNAAVCYFFEVVLKLRKNNRIFLQHGIIINDLNFLYYCNTNMRLFVTSTLPEYEFVSAKFGYPSGHVKLLGLPRFDNLHNCKVDKDLILVMPTWRQWIAKGVETKNIENTTDFIETDYFKKWSEFINSKKLDECLKKHHKKLLFYPHRNMQKYIHNFNTQSKNIEICNWENNDIQEVLKKSSVMITDYSSVFFDFLYMKKPVLFYQFDEYKFRKFQYNEGYFDYKNNSMTMWACNIDEVILNLENILSNDNYTIPCDIYEQYFPFNDNLNCERVYNAIKEINKCSTN